MRAGGLASPLLGSMFSGLVPTTSCSATVSSPATITRSSPASSTTSHTDKCEPPVSRQYASPSTPTSARRSKTSTPVQKVKSEASARRSTGRRDSLSSTSSVDRLELHTPTTSTASVKSQRDCPSLESSLLSAEAAMYASSSLFFPFALPHLLGASSPGLPFPGLLPPVSSTSSSYSPPSLLPPPQLSDDRARTNGSSSKTSATSPSRARPARSSRDADRHTRWSGDTEGMARSLRDSERPESGGSRAGRSVIVSPTSSVNSEPELQSTMLPSTPTAARNKARDGNTSWCPTELSCSNLHQSPPHKVRKLHSNVSFVV